MDQMEVEEPCGILAQISSDHLVQPLTTESYLDRHVRHIVGKARTALVVLLLQLLANASS